MTLEGVPGGITAAGGYRVGVGTAGIRDSGGPDLVLLVSDRPAGAAATFTTNRMRAAPVLVAEEHLVIGAGHAWGFVVNAGCANAGTGPDGIADARSVAAGAADAIGCAPTEVIPFSTGLIGSRLPVAAMRATLPTLRLEQSTEADGRAARAIMTTDTRPKQHAVRFTLDDGRALTVGGMAKGSGMIHPQMATMLAFVTTDAPIEPVPLRAMLREVVDVTFNQVTVDGDTSTNDAVLLLANGAAGGPMLDAAGERGLREALGQVCRALAVEIAADGEGARHLIEVTVTGAATDVEARQVARTVASSSLVKTAVHGADPNWGRIAAAVGRSGVELDAERMRIRIGDVPVYDGGPLGFDASLAEQILRYARVPLSIDLLAGDGSGVAWGCDLSAEYVAINSEYTT